MIESLGNLTKSVIKAIVIFFAITLILIGLINGITFLKYYIDYSGMADQLVKCIEVNNYVPEEVEAQFNQILENYLKAVENISESGEIEMTLGINQMISRPDDGFLIIKDADGTRENKRTQLGSRKVVGVAYNFHWMKVLQPYEYFVNGEKKDFSEWKSDEEIKQLKKKDLIVTRVEILRDVVGLKKYPDLPNK